MTTDRDRDVTPIDALPGSENASTLDGHEHGAQVSFFLSHNRPDTGPKLHRHPYAEAFIVPPEGAAAASGWIGQLARKSA